MWDGLAKAPGSVFVGSTRGLHLDFGVPWASRELFLRHYVNSNTFVAELPFDEPDDDGNFKYGNVTFIVPRALAAPMEALSKQHERVALYMDSAHPSTPRAPGHDGL